MVEDFLIDHFKKFTSAGPLLRLFNHANLKQSLNNLVSRLTLPVEIQVLWHVQLATSNVLLDQGRIFLGIFAVERITFGRYVVQTTTKRPNVSLLSQIVRRATCETLRRRVIQMTRKFGTFHKLFEIVRHTDHVPFDNAVI